MQVHQNLFKTETALLVQDHIEKLFAYDKVVISNAKKIEFSFCNYFSIRLMLIKKPK